MLYNTCIQNSYSFVQALRSYLARLGLDAGLCRPQALPSPPWAFPQVFYLSQMGARIFLSSTDGSSLPLFWESFFAWLGCICVKLPPAPFPTPAADEMAEEEMKLNATMVLTTALPPTFSILGLLIRQLSRESH